MNVSIELKQVEQNINSIFQGPSELTRVGMIWMLYCTALSVNSQASGGI
jgi:hypothetical protein